MKDIENPQEIPLDGHVSDGFEPVVEEFLKNFSDGQPTEVGAAFSVYKNGEPVVDIWGGYTSKEKTTPWQQNTTVNIYSSTKALAALCVAMLVDRKQIQYDTLVKDFWPEFACKGKELTTVGQLMSHQSGNPGLRAETSPDDLLNWDLICQRLAEQEPFWVPGEATAYHPWTYGFLAGEIVRRVAGCSIGEFLHREVAAPLCAEAYIGLPEHKDASAATLYGPNVAAPITAENPPEWVGAAMCNPVFDPEWHNQRQWRAAELPAFGGFASANGLAKIYSMLACKGQQSGSSLLTAESVDTMRSILSDREDSMMGIPVCWGAGVAINSIGVYGPNPKTFGHSGWGGSLVVADPDESLSIAYVCNQMSEHSVGDPRATQLLMKTYECLSGAK